MRFPPRAGDVTFSKRSHNHRKKKVVRVAVASALVAIPVTSTAGKHGEIMGIAESTVPVYYLWS